MDFEQLRIFLVLAEERTFLGAANRLGTSRSRVRRKLDQLEGDAGTPLLVRQQNGLVLTLAGRSLAHRGRELLEEASHLIAHVRDVGNEPTGCLRIALPYGPTPLGWDAIGRTLQARFDDLQLDFVTSGAPESLLPTHADVALSFAETEPDACDVYVMGEFSLSLFVSEAYVAARGQPSSVEELKQHRLGVWRVPDRSVDQIPLRSGSQLRITPSQISDDPARLQRNVIAGDCIGYLPALARLNDPALKILFADEIAGRVRERLLVPNVLADVPRVARFVELCRPEALSFDSAAAPDSAAALDSAAPGDSAASAPH